VTVFKTADDKQPQVDALRVLLAREDLDRRTRKEIDDKIWAIRTGIAGEKQAAYEIDFHYADRKSFAVIHDLRIEFKGRVAQIDHVILNQVMDMWVCETKSFKEGVKIDARGEWYRYGGGRAHGMPSPIAQNRNHVTVLEDLFAHGAIAFPRRIVTLKPSLLPVVLVSNEARVDRPGARAAARIKGLDSVIKIEQLVQTIEARFDERHPIGVFAKLVSEDALGSIAAQLVALHRPAPVDGPARFGLQDVPRTESAGAPGPATPAALASPRGERVCASCGTAVSEKVAAYSLAHADRFGGAVLCWECQRKAPSTRRESPA
jgi:hypothetical protein